MQKPLMQSINTVACCAIVLTQLVWAGTADARPNGGGHAQGRGTGGGNVAAHGQRDHGRDHDRDGDRSVDRRQDRQEDRIQNGIRSGELTGKEAKTLKQNEERVAELEKQLKSDGSLSPADRLKLQTELNQLSREIYQQKHDEETRKTQPNPRAAKGEPGTSAPAKGQLNPHPARAR